MKTLRSFIILEMGYLTGADDDHDGHDMSPAQNLQTEMVKVFSA